MKGQPVHVWAGLNPNHLHWYVVHLPIADINGEVAFYMRVPLRFSLESM